MSINPCPILMKIDFLTLLSVFFIRLIIDAIIVCTEHIEIKLIILLSSLTRLIKSALDRELNRYVSHMFFIHIA